ncbi:Hcp family type VI secretion system effector [Paludibaculum fermentans]|uniref:Hcp family type VI secretion system effector n=1 Tax=Paludibaculum fermentans TaxID=1473598 RepID=UPI003EBB1685
MSAIWHLKIPNIDGESEIQGYQNQIQVLSFSWGASNTAGVYGSGSSHGGSQIQEFQFTKKVDSGSPKLFAHCASGKHIKEAVLTGTRSGTTGGREEYIKYNFSDLIISSINWSAGSDQPSESISFNFGSINVQYFQIEGGKKTDQVLGGWDIQQNVAQ